MKKSLFALAAVTAFAGAAQAQSSVTVYGIMDAGALSINNTVGSSASNNNRTTGIQSGGLASPRLGFKGVEDLGGGMSAKFVLEAEILTATGQTNGVNGVGGAASSTSGQFFNRASYVALGDKKMGEVMLGLFNTSNYTNIVKFDAIGGTNLGGLVNFSNAGATTASSGNQGITNTARVNNAIGYISPKFAGLNATFASGNKAVTVQPTGTNAANQRTTDFGLNYGYKKLALAASYTTVAGSVGNMDTVGTTAGYRLLGAYGSYDFGIVKAFGSYVAVTGAGTNGSTNSVYAGGVSAPITPKIAVAASYSSFNAGSAYTNTNSSMVALKATYGLSKRTTLYALSAFSNNQANAAGQISSTSKFSGTGATTGLNQTGYMLGMNHTF